MKSAVLVENEKIEIQEKTLEKPSGKQVKVRLIACGICGSDIPRYFFNGARHYPLVLGHECCGQVIEVGPEVSSLKAGDYVVGIPLKPCFECDDCKKGDFSLCKNYKFYGSSLDGAFSEEMMVDEVNLFKIPSKIATKHAALFEPSTVALHGVRIYNDYNNKVVAVIGGGTIAQFIALWARIYGAKKVVMFLINHDNDAIYHNMGFNDLALSTEEGISDAIEKYTNGKGFDLIFDGAGVNITMINALKLAANHANICLVGTPPKDVSFTKKQWELINRKEVFITGTWMSYSKNWPGDEWRETSKALENGQLKLSDDFFAAQFKLEDINEAFKFIKEGKKGKEGRVLILMNEH